MATRITLLALLVILLTAVPAAAGETSYDPFDGDLVNPERGLYEAIDLVDETDLGWVRDKGYTLAFAYIRLDDYRTSPVPKALLDDVTRGLDAARAAGIKVIIRISYNFGIGEDDAPKSWVLRHIDQFEPIFTDHEDVILVVQAGFIGAWGEWHSSTNGLDTPANKAEIRDAVLDAVPATRMVQFRYPPDIETWAPTPLGAADAYTGSDLARTAHHNDCFLANDTDAGTYWPGNVEGHKTYIAAASQFMVVGGETCQVGLDANQARRSCAVATAELARFHWTYLNSGFHEPTLQIWKDQGCWDEITRSLGYRYRLVSSHLPNQVVAGGTLGGQTTIANDGYATLSNPRTAYLVLDGPTRVDLPLPDDPRLWTAGEDSVLTLGNAVPHSLPAGQYTLALWLPDGAPSLQDRPDYAVRFANTGIWDAATGYNTLGTIDVLPATVCTGDVGSRFTDVTADNVFCGDVEWLADAGITLGCNPPANDAFCPSQPVTRGQMAAFLHRALADDLTAGPAPGFEDAVGHVFEGSILWLGSTSVTKGCNPPVNDRYCPDQPVTRGQMAAFLDRALDLPAAGGDTFTDDDGSQFEPHIEALAATGVTRGCNPPVNDLFCPHDSVTRQQMAAFLHRALGNG